MIKNHLFTIVKKIQNFMSKTCNFIASEETTVYTETNKY